MQVGRRRALYALAAVGTTVAAVTLVSVTGAADSATATAFTGHFTKADRAPQLPALTPRQLAGQRAIYSYSGTTPPASLLQKIRAGEAAGVIFFGQNITSHAQIAKVIDQLVAANKSSPVHAPLLLMTDQEGGKVRRLTGAPTLSEKQIGERPYAAKSAAMAGTGAGRNLLSVGMNVNLAPVLDVFRQPGDFDDQYERSYSNDPKKVATLGSAFIKAQQATGVAATSKHFPGLGPATAQQNTDLRPVTLHVSAKTLRAVDELPYRSAVRAGTKLVMVSWAVYPAFDAHRPAGLSPTIVKGELRKRLGFQGVTITDAIEAGALKSFGTSAQRGVLAAGAGMDLILYSAQNVTQGIDGVTALGDAYQSGRLNQADFRAAAQRVLALRLSLPH